MCRGHTPADLSRLDMVIICSRPQHYEDVKRLRRMPSNLDNGYGNVEW